MTGEEKRSRRNSIVIKILVLAVIFILFCASVILTVQVIKMRHDINKLQQTVCLLQEKLDADNLLDNGVSAGVEIVMNNSEMAADEQTAEIDALENQEAWNFENEQDSKPWDSKNEIRRVYLTFDDGPSANTDKILDILDEYGVKATFFVVGKEGYSGQYQRIVEDGHTLGMHSYSHKYGEIYQSLESYQQDLTRLHDFLYEITGVDSRIVRFPGGSSNTISKVDMQDLIKYLSDENMIYYDWNISSGDATSKYISPERIADNVLDNVWKHKTSIVLMHDAADKNTTVEALPIIIEKILESEKTVLLPISEETVPIQHISME